MRTDSIWFHLISLGFTAIGLWMYASPGDWIGLGCALFFGGGWVATQLLRWDAPGQRWPRAAGGLASLGVAAGCVIMAVSGAVVIGALGALFFGAAGIALLIGAFRDERKGLVVPGNPVLPFETVESELATAFAAYPHGRAAASAGHVEGAVRELPVGPDPVGALVRALPAGLDIVGPTGVPGRLLVTGRGLAPVVLVGWVEQGRPWVAAYAREGVVSLKTAGKAVSELHVGP